MLQKLALIFDQNFTLHFDSQNQDWYWFTSEDTQYFGIKKTALQKEQLQLFNQLFLPITNNVVDYSLTTNQMKWKNFLFSNVELLPTTYDKKVHFYYFYLEHPIDHYLQLMEIVSEFFFKAITIPEHPTHFLVVDENPSSNSNQTRLEDLIDILMNDFSTKLYVYIGQYQKVDSSLKQKFTLEHALFQSFYMHRPKGNIIYFQQLLPIEIASNPISQITNILSNLFLDALEDSEMIQSIHTFFKYNLNVSLAAKKLFIHRNSLLYRIEKFQDLTGLDIRNFHDAAFVYYCIPLLDKKIIDNLYKL